MSESRAIPRWAAGERVPQTLAERFWSIAKGMEGAAPEGETGDPIAAVRHVLAVLDAFERGAAGPQVSANTLSFLMLLRQQEMLGDLLYASPEQARGENVDERSLVFSVGVLLFERLTGRHPFGAEGNPKRMARIRRGELGSGVNFFPVVPAGLRHILLKAMGPFPEERWSSLAELRGRLEDFLAEATGENRTVSDVSKTQPLVLRRASTEEEKTRVMPRARLVEPAREAERDPAREPVREVEIGASLALRRPWRFVGPMMWMLLGACLATTAFLIANAPVQRSEPRATSSAKTAPAIAPTPAGAAVPATEPAQRSAPTPVPAAPVPEPAPIFDPQLGGERALTAARACFSPKRIAGGVSFGLGVLYGEDGPSRKVYLPADHLEPAERSCLGKQLVGIDAGAPPEKSTVVDYRFQVRGESGEVTIRPSRAPASDPEL